MKQPVDVNDKDTDPLNGVRGWLLLLGTLLVFFQPIYSLVQLMIGYARVKPFFDSYPGLLDAVVWNMGLMLVLVVMGMGVGFWLLTVRPGAVRYTQIYLIAVPVYNLLSWGGFILFSGLPQPTIEAMQKEGAMGVLQGVIFAVIWILYLRFSRRVKVTFSQGASKREWQ